ncbi:MAG: phosphatidylserine decarboxylase [Pseudomonadota bacterium]
MLNLIKKNFHPIHSEGYIFVACFAIVTFVVALADFEVLAFIGLILTTWCYYFFRNPDRLVPTTEGAVVSPADGIVQSVSVAKAPGGLEIDQELEFNKVSIFLDIFNVHVNRCPIKGKITKLVYHTGKFINASLDKASEDNERQSCVVQTEDNQEIIFVQIAGLVARRIVCNLYEDQEVKTGERYGIIKFGSRVDLYLPLTVNPQVAVGQQVIGGETIIANLQNNLPKISAEKM